MKPARGTVYPVDVPPAHDSRLNHRVYGLKPAINRFLARPPARERTRGPDPGWWTVRSARAGGRERGPDPDRVPGGLNGGLGVGIGDS